jgi:hypothetical protein
MAQRHDAARDVLELRGRRFGFRFLAPLRSFDALLAHRIDVSARL